MSDARTERAPLFSVVRGGPFFRLQRRLHLEGSGNGQLFLRAAVLTALAWLLPLLCTVLPGAAAGEAGLYLRDLQAYGRLLFAVPVFIFAEPYIDSRLRLAVRSLSLSGLVPGAAQPRLEAALTSIVRARDSGVAEAALLVIAFAVAAVQSIDPLWIRTPLHVPGTPLSPPAAAYLAVSLPLFRFLLLRWLWRGLIWARFLVRVARLPLALVPTHPDLAGGLRFLANYQSCFAVLVLALGGVLVSSWPPPPVEGAIAQLRHHLSSQVVFAAVTTLVVFAPLGAFILPLLRAKRLSDPHLDALAARHSRAFETRWYGPPEGQVLGAPDFSSQADLASAYQLAHRLRVFPFSPTAVLLVVAAGLAPLVPLLIADHRLLHVLVEVARKVF